MAMSSSVTSDSWQSQHCCEDVIKLFQHIVNRIAGDPLCMTGLPPALYLFLYPNYSVLQVQVPHALHTPSDTRTPGWETLLQPFDPRPRP